LLGNAPLGFPGVVLGIPWLPKGFMLFPLGPLSVLMGPGLNVLRQKAPPGFFLVPGWMPLGNYCQLGLSSIGVSWPILLWLGFSPNKVLGFLL